MRLEAGGPRLSGTRPAGLMLARSPFVAGKTRLTAGLDETAATALRAALLLDTLDAVLAPGWPIRVHLEPPDHAVRVEALLREDAALAPEAPRVSWHPQADGDLGSRMIAAVSGAIAAGHDLALVVGSDIPDLPTAALVAARDALVGTPRGTAVALGPVDDGGFYLVAATDGASLAAACAGVRWSQPTVLDDVTVRLTASGRHVVRVTPWADVDDRADLAALVRRAGTGAARTRRAAHAIRIYNRPW